MSDEPQDTTGAQDIYELDPSEELGADQERLVQEAVAAVERSGQADDDVHEADTSDRDEAAQLRERHLRALADFENYRRRAERDRREMARLALTEPLREFLEVVDNLDRALGADGDGGDVKAGVAMILRQMRELLKRFGVEEISAEGEPFDPAVHEAVLRFEDAEVSEPTVTEELQKGYKLQDRLLRPAMVKVAVPAAGSGETGGGADD